MNPFFLVITPTKLGQNYKQRNHTKQHPSHSLPPTPTTSTTPTAIPATIPAIPSATRAHTPRPARIVYLPLGRHPRARRAGPNRAPARRERTPAPATA